MADFLQAISSVQSYLWELGYSLKRRDSREPGRARKELAEAKLQRLVLSHFGRQRDALSSLLERKLPAKGRAVKDIGDDDIGAALGVDDGFDGDMLELYLQSTKDGVSLFRESSPTIALDYKLTNKRAADRARKYVGELIKGIDDTTRETVRAAVAAFVETPGMTVGDVIDRLPFNAARAESVAVTEITRAYSQAAQVAGEQAKEDFPDVTVIKRWFTNRDDLVCPICEPLDGAEVDIDEDFDDGIDAPPAHPGCRCWVNTTTRI